MNVPPFFRRCSGLRDKIRRCTHHTRQCCTQPDTAALSVVPTAWAAERAWTRAKETRHTSQTLLPLQPAGLPPPLSRRDASHCTAAQQTARRCRESTTMEALLSTGLERRPLLPRAVARSRPASGPVASSSVCDHHHELAAPAAPGARRSRAVGMCGARPARASIEVSEQRRVSRLQRAWA